MCDKYFDFPWCLQNSLKSLLTTITVLFFFLCPFITKNRDNSHSHSHFMLWNGLRECFQWAWNMQCCSPRNPRENLTLQGRLKTRSQIPSMLSVEDAQIPSIETMEHSALELPSPRSKDCQRMPPSSFFHSLKFSPEHICRPPFKTQSEREIFTKWPARPEGHHYDISHIIWKISHQGKEYTCSPLSSGWKGSDLHSVPPVVNIAFFIWTYMIS